MAHCRECHRKMSTFSCSTTEGSKLTVDDTAAFKIPEVKFLIVSSAAGKCYVS